MADRPHSRKVKIAEGTAEVKKGEKLDNSPMAGSGGAPLGTDEKSARETKQEDERKA